MCWRHGIPIHRYPLFSDEGALLPTLTAIQRTWKISFHLQICEVHLLRNTCNIGNTDIFQGPKYNGVYPWTQIKFTELSKLRTAKQFFKTLLNMLYSMATTCPLTALKIVSYIFQRHPKTWADFANTKQFQPKAFHNYAIKLTNSLLILTNVTEYYLSN